MNSSVRAYPLPRAFLSHRSSDKKEMVKKIADKLGREKCIYDEHVFKTSDDFKDAIDTHLPRAQLFVFFASKDSQVKDSLAEKKDGFDYVKYELEVMERLYAEKIIIKKAVYIIDE